MMMRCLFYVFVFEATENCMWCVCARLPTLYKYLYVIILRWQTHIHRTHIANIIFSMCTYTASMYEIPITSSIDVVFSVVSVLFFAITARVFREKNICETWKMKYFFWHRIIENTFTK